MELSDDEDEDNDDGERNKKRQNKSRLRNSLKETISRIIGQNMTPGGRMIMISKDSTNGLSASKVFNGFSNNNNNKNNNDDNDDDNDEEDDDDDDEEDENDLMEMKETASRTLLAIKWLFKNKRITNEEKQIMTTDIIESLSSGQYSKAEIAYLLLIGGFRPGEGEVASIPIDLSKVDKEDLNDFETLCHKLCDDYRNN